AGSHRLLTEVLRGRWGFNGTVVADYWSVSFLHSMHEVAEDEDAAGLLSLEAGMDVELPETTAFANLAQAVRSGALDQEVLDTAVRRVLAQKLQMGLLDPDWNPRKAWLGEDVELDSADNRAHA